MRSYYSDKLSAEDLKRCYDIAPPRVQQYLAAEIEHVRSRIKTGGIVLELGCGYGRVLAALGSSAARFVGIDISFSSLHAAQNYIREYNNVFLYLMDAVNMGFRSACFDVVFCIQNGISAFHVDQHALIISAASVTKPGGRVLFSSYAEEFWDDRMAWFRIQSAHGLLGEIDDDKTGDGVIVCKDGFRATTVSREDFLQLTDTLGKKVSIEKVDNSNFSQVHVRILRFSRNFGQTAAMQAGFDYANGDVIITLDGDLQNDPSDIPRLLQKIEEGYDVVCGWRRART